MCGNVVLSLAELQVAIADHFWEQTKEAILHAAAALAWSAMQTIGYNALGQPQNDRSHSPNVVCNIYPGRKVHYSSRETLLVYV